MALYPHRLSPYNIEPHVSSVFLASVDCSVKHLCYTHIPDMLCSGKPDHIPESPCLGLLPASSPPAPILQEESPSQGHAFQITNQTRVHSPTLPLPSFHVLSYYPPAPMMLDRYQTARDSPYAPEPTEIIQTIQS